MITLLGTSHISPESIKNIRGAIDKKPDCVAVELDPMRYYALKTKKSTSPPGLFLKILSWMQKILGKYTGIFPGQEMLEAVNYAKRNKIPACLIDQDFRVTVNDLKKISSWEKFKLFIMAVFSGFRGEIDLKKVPSEELVKQALDYLKEKFPKLYKILVVKRNRYMALCIKKLSENYKNILVVVGAGHIEGLQKLLKGEKIKVI